MCTVKTECILMKIKEKGCIPTPWLRQWSTQRNNMHRVTQEILLQNRTPHVPRLIAQIPRLHFVKTVVLEMLMSEL